MKTATRVLRAFLLGLLFLALAPFAHATIFYVATNGSDSADGTSWATAKQTIQAGVDAAYFFGSGFDIVLVSNGVYATGSRDTPGSYSCSNRVVINGGGWRVQSVNGAAVTVIDGGNAVRCVYIGGDSSLSGFTLRNGKSLPDGSGNSVGPRNDNSGGGAVGGGTLINCTLSANWAVKGGGAYSCTLSNCTLSGNSASYFGGGASDSTLNICVLSGNSAVGGGGGANWCMLNNCTLSGNSAVGGGGAEQGTLNNCIVYFNTAVFNPNCDSSTLNYSCSPGLTGAGNITNDPQFVDAANSNFHLKATSPCIDAGNNAYATNGVTDFDGNPRIVNGTVDMGAYEYQFVTVSVVANGGTASGGGIYIPGSNVVISAAPANGHWFFTGWNDGDTNLTRTITVPLANITYTATFTQYVGALVWYVATNGNDAADGMSWPTAKQTIQAAVDLAIDGDTVIVSNGVYATGTRGTPGGISSNRAVIGKNITVQSVNGSAVTVIDGGSAVRCVFMSAGTLNGFTLQNGRTLTLGTLSTGDDIKDLRGGGANCIFGGVLNNCTLSGNSAWWGGGSEGGTLNNCSLSGNSSGDVGGGSCQGTLNNCTLSGNSANEGGGASLCTLNNCTLTGNSSAGVGGGADFSTLNNCVLSGNLAFSGGGAYNGTLNNCTLTGNSARFSGGGSYVCAINNCIVYSNSAPTGPNHYGTTFGYSCTTPMPAGTGNITNDPQFVDAANSNFHLLASSPCIDTGGNSYATGTADLDGNPRIVNGTVDMGAYEAGPRAVVSVATNPANGGVVSGGGLFFAGTNATLQASANPYWNFVDWSDGDTNATRTIIVPASNVTFTANFAMQLATVFVATNPANGGTVSGGGTYQANSNIVLTASPAAYWLFTGWSDGVTDATRTIIVPVSDITYAANFTQHLATVSVLANPTYGGTATGGGTYQVNSNVVLSAAANQPCYLFVNWSDGETNPVRTIAVPSSNITYTANFALQMGTIVAQASPACGGNVFGGGTYPVLTSVQILAAPSPGWRFIGWNDGRLSPVRYESVPVGGANYTALFRHACVPVDFDGDGRSDIAVYVPRGNEWDVLQSSDGPAQLLFGSFNTVPASADYDGDGQTDYAVRDEAATTWFIVQSSNATPVVTNWDGRNTIVVSADYDGDGVSDMATYDPAAGMWAILQSSNRQTRTQQWGWSKAIPVPADYDGDGRTDIATYDLTTGNWCILQSGNNRMRVQQWGWSKALPVPADYDGDGKADIATYVPDTGTWYILKSSGGMIQQQWGWSADAPVPADYDGDGKADIAVYYPAMGMWHILKSSGGVLQQQWGWSGAQPVLQQFQINRLWFPSP